MEEYLRQFGIFSSKEITDLTNMGELRIFSKNDFFIREGMVCQEIAFIVSGIFRSFYLSQSAEEVTYCFIFPDNLMAPYSSYITGEKTFENMQAIQDSEVLIFSKKDLNSFLESHPKGDLFSKIIAQQQYLELEKRIFKLQIEPAHYKYESLLKEHPEYINQIPLQFIASYLGITQRHLSRLRRNKISN